MTTSKKITQTNGILQGDPLSPLLFNIATANISTILSENEETTLIMYADDMALGSANKEELQATLLKLEKWVEENGFDINMGKTVQMTFKKGGRRSPADTLRLKNEPLKVEKSFKYLGMTLQTTLTSFSQHIQEKSAAATKAIYSIDNIRKTSLTTAMALFTTTISPIVTYGMDIMWEKLKVGDLKRIEGVKARFLKPPIGIGKTAPSRLAYELAKETFYIEVLRMTLLLPSTAAYNTLLEERRQKRTQIEPDFYSTGAMSDRNWEKTNQEQRHVVTRYAVHGFHHKVCKTKTFHKPNEKCICELCNQQCDRYHIEKCAKNTKTLSEYSKE